jgi:amino acid adenylation domain-containing protein
VTSTADDRRKLGYLVNHLVEAAAESRPDAIAVVDGERSFTYGELDRLSNQVANHLCAEGVRRGDRVGLCLEKSFEAVCAIYGVLKAGAAYVPLDPKAPATRQAYILRDASVQVLLSSTKLAATWEVLRGEGADFRTVVALDGEIDRELAGDGAGGVRILDAADIASADASRCDVATTDFDLAYILYTSGSTGTPKGVMLTHRNCLAFVEWAGEEFGVTADDRVSSHAPLHFDLSTFDLFAAARAGALVVLAPPAVSVFPVELRRFIEGQGITVWYSVPTVLTMLVTRGGLEGGEFPHLRVILFAGEVFPTPHLRRLTQLLPHVRFANLFGPTETNVCTWWEVPTLPEEMTESIPIGRAIENVDVFALTDEGTLAAPGEVGELCVRGATVMQGYLGDPERTAERLVPNPLGGGLDQPVYRTGDLVEEMPDGAYRFLGRRDSQIKSRGYRIELGDVETALHAHPSVVECAVIAIPDDVVTNRLKAFVTTQDGELAKADLVAFCAERVPQYMIPEEFEFSADLPRTSTGKIDRRALATPQAG